MFKLKHALVAPLAAVALVGGIASPAQAAVTGGFYNAPISGSPWIMVSPTWPPTSTSLIYPWTSGRGKGFISPWPCVSPWGYEYSEGVWRQMTSTSTLVLKCRR